MNYNIINNKDEKMANLVLDNHFLIFVLERFGIALGTQEKTVTQVCNENNISVELFLSIANLHINANIIPSITLNNTDIYAIISYLKKSHEYYSTEAIPNISNQIELLNDTNKDSAHTLILRFFNEYKKDISNHLLYEESIVYPYIVNLLNLKNGEKEYTISNYKHNHNDIESKLYDLKNLLIKHLPDKNNLKFRRKLLLELFRFEKDLIIHSIIEESILIPHIEKIENQLINNG